ncbi:16S rRNA (guanine(527)-N(7))-methyltransferase RsmG [Peptococcaceae bacterium]|nr:16S rRNA (guanine(527)-N(7))-methyltransferase RsmG [Peptococcaceae bacterium]
MNESFVKTLISVGKELGFEFTQQQLNKFNTYYEYLVEFNKQVNLTSITRPEKSAVKHFIDSLTCLYCMDIGSKRAVSIIDIGTGAGFPGMVLKIYNNDFKLTLLDSLRKRIIFLNSLISKIETNDVEVIHDRAENLGRDRKHREMYDFAVSRAVAELPVLVEYCLPFVKIGGCFIALKGSKGLDEIKNAEHAIKELGGKIVGFKNIKLPLTAANRTLIKIKKAKKTPEKFPRKAGIPAKRPLSYK